MRKITVNTKEMLEKLVSESALTWEGLNIDDKNLSDTKSWIEKYTPMIHDDFYIISGFVMNSAYGLTGDNAYPDDLNIVSVRLDDLEDYQKIIIPRFEVGARWLDDIVDNNLRREKEND